MKKLFASRLSIDIAGRTVALAIIIFLTRHLGAAGFGKLAFGLSIVNIAYLFCEFGIPQIFLKEIGEINFGGGLSPGTAEGLDRGKIIWKETLGLKFSLAALTFLFILAFSRILWPWAEPSILILLFGFMIGNNFVDFCHQACNASNKIGVSAAIMISHRVFLLLGLIAAILLSDRLFSIAAGLCLGSLLGCATALLIVRGAFGYPLRPRWNPGVWVRWLKISFPLSSIGIIINTYIRLGLLLLPWFVADRELGYFAAGHKLFETGYMVPSALMAIALPRLAGSFKNSPEGFGHIIRKVILLILLLSAAWLAGGLLFGRLIIKTIYGPAYLPSVPIFQILVLVNVLSLFNVLLYYAMFIFDLLYRQLLNVAMVGLLSGVLTVTLINRAGAIGASWALVITEGVLLTLTVITMIRLGKWRLLFPARGTANP